MGSYKVSVAIATYNGEQFIREQIDSIINQTYQVDEIIVSDDNSKDSTYNILLEYRGKVNIKIVKNEGSGVVSNFKNAVSHCNPLNEYFALADQDDIWKNDKIEKSIAAITKLDSQKPSLIYSDLSVVDSHNKLINNSFFKEIVRSNPQQEDLDSILYSNKVIGCTVMFNAKMKDIFFEMPNAVCMHDYWLALVAYTFGTNNYIPQQLINYRRHLNNVTSVKDSFFTKFNKEILDYILNREITLDGHIATAKLFFNMYQSELNTHETQVISNFIKLEKSTVLEKRLKTFYRTFFNRKNF